MAAILQFWARSLSRAARKTAKNPCGRTSLGLESSNARGYHRNSAVNAANFFCRGSNQKFCLESRCRPLPLINRSIQTTSALRTTKDVVVPQFADSISEGDVQFLKKVGDSVVEDDIVCEIETDKTSIEVPTPGRGVIEELYVENGSVVKPGMKLFRIKLEG